MTPMNKFSLYILLIFLFLGLSKSFSPSEQRTYYIENEHVYSSFFHGGPLEVILTDYFRAGFLIKTYFHQYKVIHGFRGPEFFTVRVSKKLWNAHRDHIGMSLFRRRDLDNQESTIALPPGSLFVGDPSFGFWEENIQTNKKLWFFHRAYRNFPNYFAWGNFIPDIEFHKNVLANLHKEEEFFGNNHEFGSKSAHAKKIYPSKKAFAQQEAASFKDIVKKLFSSPWKNEEL